MNDAIGNKTIVNARVTLVFAGYGDLALTDVALIWNKSATSYLAFGLLNVVMDNHLMIPLTDIVEVSTYTYFPGGGLVITRNDGKKYKIAFKKKKEFKIAYEYLTQYIGSKN